MPAWKPRYQIKHDQIRTRWSGPGHGRRWARCPRGAWPEQTQRTQRLQKNLRMFQPLLLLSATTNFRTPDSRPVPHELRRYADQQSLRNPCLKQVLLLF